MRKIKIQNRHEKNLAAVLHEPDKLTNKLVVFVQSFKGDKDYQPVLRECSENLSEVGIAALRYDAYGSGESEGSHDELTVTTQVQDLEDVIAWARQQGYTSIGLSGISLGNSVIQLSSRGEIKALVMLSPPFTSRRTGEEYLKKMGDQDFCMTLQRAQEKKMLPLSRAYAQELYDLNLDQVIPRTHEPTLIIYGSQDELCYVEYDFESELAKFPTRPDVEVIEGADHDFWQEKHWRHVIEITVLWFQKHL